MFLKPSLFNYELIIGMPSFCLLMFVGFIIFPPNAAVAGSVPHRITLVTIDTIRADSLGCYGRADSRTPYLDRISKQGMTLKHMVTDVPLTLPSHCSLMTGKSVYSHGIRLNNGYLFQDNESTIAWKLRQKGFRTAAFIGGYPLKKVFGLDGGFDHYDDTLEHLMQTQSVNLERRAEKVVASWLQWFQLNAGSERTFTWVHLYDPHSPYSPPEPYGKIFGHPYFGEISYTDKSIGRIDSALKASLKQDVESLLIIVGDHGESLGDHGESTHGLHTYEEVLHVPCLILGLGKASIVSATMTIQKIAELLTEQEYTRDDEKFSERTKSSLFHQASKSSNGEKLYFETLFPLEKYRWSPIMGIRQGKWKLIKSPIPELYNLDEDPREQRNLYYKQYKKAMELLDFIERQFPSQGHLSQAKKELTEDDRQALTSLGYLGGNLRGSASVKAGELPDVKSRMPCLPAIERGNELIQSGHPMAALEYLTEAVACDPTNPDVSNNLGISYQAHKRYDEAEEAFRQAVKLSPDNARYVNNLGSVLKRKNDIYAAIQCYRRAVQLDPAFFPAVLNLAIATYENGDKTTACSLLKKATASGLDNELRDRYIREMNCQ